jgi:hypothetical protein
MIQISVCWNVADELPFAARIDGDRRGALSGLQVARKAAHALGRSAFLGRAIQI